MKVKELIERLSGMNPEAKVMTEAVNNGSYYHIEDSVRESDSLVILKSGWRETDEEIN